mgnify:CR=1 FL=1
MRTPYWQDVIEEAIFTERSTQLTENQNAYTFRVAPSATKIDIKRAVEEAFNVKVKHVRTVNVRGKTSTRWARRRFLVGTTSSWKKAIVTLQPGYGIDFV